MATYKARYAGENIYIGRNIVDAKNALEKKMIADSFKDYELAWIFRYNIIGRTTHSCYYSKITGGSWKTIDIPFDRLNSWIDSPLYKIAKRIFI